MDERGVVLLPIARAAIGRALGLAAEADESAEWLRQSGASFVTLRLVEELRGCIGSLEACRPLLEDVKSNAVAAALRDHRFAPLSANELPQTRVEVSLLSPLEPIAFRDEDDALAQLRPFEDGVVVALDARRATFLPQVWEALPEPWEFMAQLMRKARIGAHRWPEGLRLWRYRVEKFVEE